MDGGPPDHNPDENVRAALRALQLLIDRRAEILRQANNDELGRIDRQIPVAMRDVGDAYHDQNTRRHWYQRAEEYERSPPDQREHILMPLARGLGILIATPFLLVGGIVGGTLFAAGSILYGAGMAVKGLGTLLTGGFFRR